VRIEYQKMESSRQNSTNISTPMRDAAASAPAATLDNNVTPSPPSTRPSGTTIGSNNSTTAPRQTTTTLLRPTAAAAPAASGEIIDVDSNNNNEDNEKECFGDYDKKCAAEWDALRLTKIFQSASQSWVYDHVFQAALKKDVRGSDLLKTSAGLQKVADPEHWVCMRCKDEGKALSKCILKLPKGLTRNVGRHLSNIHTEELARMKAEEEEAKKAIKKCNAERSQKLQETRSKSR